MICLKKLNFMLKTTNQELKLQKMEKKNISNYSMKKELLNI